MPTNSHTEPLDNPEAKPRVKRRWYQFSLRAMFVWVAFVGVLLTIGLRWIAPAQRQWAVVQMVERLKGGVRYSTPRKDEGRLTTWLRDWLPRDYFDSVEYLELFLTSVTDADLQSLGGLTKLQHLGLAATKVTDAGLDHLTGLKQLQTLSLEGTEVTALGVKRLSDALPNLQITHYGFPQNPVDQPAVP